MKAKDILNKMLDEKDRLDNQILEHTTDCDEDYTPDGIPNSWLDAMGIRHAYIWDEGLDIDLRISKVNGKWVLNETAPF